MMNKSISIIFTLLLIFCSPIMLAADDDEAADAPEQDKLSYVSLGKKPMVLNLSTDSSRLTFLQIQADILVKNDTAKEAVEANIPAIRHKLIVLLSEQKAKDMKTPATREEIRKQATIEIRNMIEKMTDNKDIDEVLFSNFLVQ